MNLLVIDTATRDAISEAIDRARADTLPLDVVVRTGSKIDQSTDMLPLAERPPGSVKPPGKRVMFVGGYCAAISFEHQPAGLCRHISVSASRPGTLPSPEVVTVISREFGFEHFPGDPDLFRVWFEEFDPGHYAVNVVEVMELA